ncbi:hypothetical protein FRC11_010055, partial [Ceratobasidium sp. 423]
EDHVVCIGTNWTIGYAFIGWTYVIDFDNLVFTVNGAIHFPFDNMPPLGSSDNEPGWVEYLESYERIEIPAKYLTTVDLWPTPSFDVTQAQQQYNELRPTIVSLPEWGTPTWDSLSVSQHLGTSIVKTLVDDYSDELALAQYSSVWHKIGLFCWRVTNAAAPSHLIFPPLSAAPESRVVYVRTDLVKEPESVTRTIHHHMGGKGTLGRYCIIQSGDLGLNTTQNASSTQDLREHSSTTNLESGLWMLLDMIKKDTRHHMRIQTVDRRWEMVIGNAPAAEIQEESDRPFTISRLDVHVLSVPVYIYIAPRRTKNNAFFLVRILSNRNYDEVERM